MIRRILSGLREVLRPTQPADPDPASTAADTAARTRWVRDRRQKGGGD